MRLSDFKGRPLLLDFWATWCEACRESIPVYKNIQERYGKQGLVVVGICEGSHADSIRRFALKNRMNYAVLLDTDDEVGQSYDIYAIPTAILVGADGRIIKRWDGFDEEVSEKILSRVERLMEAGPGAGALTGRPR